jgi:hypothetical protein
VVKIFQVILILATMALLPSCSTDRGGSQDWYNKTNNGEGNPAPAASPSLRPGLNPQDPRDAQFGARPDTSQSVPPTKP